MEPNFQKDLDDLKLIPPIKNQYKRKPAEKLSILDLVKRVATLESNVKELQKNHALLQRKLKQTRVTNEFNNT